MFPPPLHSPLTKAVVLVESVGGAEVVVIVFVQKLLTKVALLCREPEECENHAKR